MTSYKLKAIRDLRGSVLIDTNILVFVYILTDRFHSDSRIRTYSDAYEELCANKDVKTYVTIETLCEFCNSHKWVSCKKLGIKRSDYKNKRNTPDGIVGQETLRTWLESITAKHTVLYSSMEVPKLVNWHVDYSIDFPDTINLDACIKNRLILMTDDGDFKCVAKDGPKIDVLTNNSIYFS